MPPWVTDRRVACVPDGQRPRQPAKAHAPQLALACACPWGACGRQCCAVRCAALMHGSSWHAQVKSVMVDDANAHIASLKAALAAARQDAKDAHRQAAQAESRLHRRRVAARGQRQA
jgi:outer membrane murein-binding lipoprotein Lpp